MLEQITKTYAGQERQAVRWGPDGQAYLCTPEGDCADAAVKALEWARANGVSEGELERDGGTVLNVTDDDGGDGDADRRESARRRFTSVR